MDIAFIEDRLKQPLPGERSHMKMAPAHRKEEFRNIRDKEINPRLSAVIVLLFQEESKLKVVFIRRGEYVGIHSGQIAFPGGRYEPEDGDLKETAKRELEEELGIARERYRIVGQLTDLYIPPSNFLVRAFVAYTEHRPAYTPDPREVSEVIEADLNDFFEPSVVKLRDFPAHNSSLTTNAPCYELNGASVWGATAMMMTELIDILTDSGIAEEASGK